MMVRWGFEPWRGALVITRCRRCKRNAGLWEDCQDGTEGAWANHHDNRCRCVPPPSRPQGAELDELVAKAWLKINPTGTKPYKPRLEDRNRAPVTHWV